jgi:sugar/nucleoside kinase (ribokinase family)
VAELAGMADCKPVAGHLCLDLIPGFHHEAPKALEDIFRPGALTSIGGMVAATGGTVSNTGNALRIFGCRVRCIARVGDDAVGGLILKEMGRYGATQGIRVAHGEASSYTVVLAPPGVDRFFLHCPGTNDTFTAHDVDARLLSGARLFHFGYPPLMRRMYDGVGGEQARVLRKAAASGLTTSLDMAMPDPQAPAGMADWPAILSSVLPHVDLFLPSAEEAFYCMHPDVHHARKAEHISDFVERMVLHDFQELAESFLSMGCGLVALKAGRRGWYLRAGGAGRLERAGRLGPHLSSWAGREVWCPAYRVERAKSTLGAGDSSIAGFLTALLRGAKLEQCLRSANVAGAHNLSALDALSGLRTWPGVVADGERMEVLEVPAALQAGWRYRPDTGVYQA